MIEKPFGHDLKSAQALNEVVEEVFPPDSVFRIDHYLGKETVQNILALRFANQLCEPVWNANYVDHVQITMAEDIGIGGRAGYYDGIGAARDVIQNHLLQLLALTAMEEPVSFDARELRAEKEKVLSAVRLPKDLSASTARGRYAAGWQGGQKVVGYLDEDGIPQRSTTETFAAVQLEIDTRRWAGVPFYLRTGKRLGRRVTEIAVVFKRAPHLPFESTATEELGPERAGGAGAAGRGRHHPVRVQGARADDGGARRDDGLRLHARLHRVLPRGLRAADPGRPARRPAAVPAARGGRAVLEDPRPVLSHWASKGQPEPYPAGSWGPPSADAMMARTGRSWRRP